MVANHLDLLKETAVEEFSKDTEPKIRLILRKFESTMGTIQQLREKVLDVDGKFTRPFRNKLESLNAAVIAQIEENNNKEKFIKEVQGEIDSVQNDINTLKFTTELINKKKLASISAELEEFLLDLNPNGEEKRIEIKENMEYLKSEYEKVLEMTEDIKIEYKKVKENMRVITEELSYSRLDAKIQGVHTVTSLMEKQLRRVSSSSLSTASKNSHSTASSSVLRSDPSLPQALDVADTQSNEEEAHVDYINPLGAIFDPSRQKDIMSFNRIIIKVLEYLGDAEIEQLGAMALDESIHADILGGMKMVITEQQNKLEMERIKSLEQEIDESVSDITSNQDISNNEISLNEKLTHAVQDIMKLDNPKRDIPPSTSDEEDYLTSRGGIPKRPNSRATRLLRRVIVEEGADQSALPKLITSSDLPSKNETAPLMAITTIQKQTTSPKTAIIPSLKNDGMSFQKGTDALRRLSKKTSIIHTIPRRESQGPVPTPKLALIVSKDHVVSSFIGKLKTIEGSECTSMSSNSSTSLSHINDTISSTPLPPKEPTPPPSTSSKIRKSTVGVLRRSVNIK